MSETPDHAGQSLEETMTHNNEADLHTLLDGLIGGEHAKAKWKFDRHVITAEGPIDMDGRTILCDLHIRWDKGGINDRLISLEVANDEEEVTVAREDEKALHALLDSLKEGETVTAEWGTVEGAMSITGKVRAHGLLREVTGYGNCGLRERNGVLHHFLRSVTVRRTVVKRWERESNE